MKCYYPIDSAGNRIGFKTPEACVYDANGTSLPTKLAWIKGKISNINNTADANKSVKYATSAGSANSVAWNNVSGKPSTYTPSSHTHTISQVTNLQSSLDGKAAKSHTHAIGDISNLQNTINSKVSKDTLVNAGYNSWAKIRIDNAVGAHGTYPTSGYAELIIILRYSDSTQVEFHSIPCIDGKPWMAASNTNGLYLGKGDVHNATAANFTKYGAYFNTNGQFSAGSLTAVYIYGRKSI